MKSAFDNMNDNKRKVENWIDGEISKSTSDRYEIVTDSATGESVRIGHYVHRTGR